MTIIGQLSEYFVLAPFFSLSAATVLLITLHWLRIRAWIISFGLILLLLAGWLVIAFYGDEITAWGIRFDRTSILGLILIMPPLVCIMAKASMFSKEYDRGLNQTLLIMLSGLGAIGTIAAHNFMMLFLSLQCMSIPIYALLATEHKDKEAVKASLSYLVLSGIAIAFMLFGILLVYAAHPAIDFFKDPAHLSLDQSNALLGKIGVGFVWFAFFFKLGLFPLQFWTPSVYQHAPFSALSLLIILSKTAMLLALMRLWPALSFFAGDSLINLPYLLSLLTIFVGNALLVKETLFYRWLAYLSMGHMGLVCLVLQNGSEFSFSAIFTDLLAFILSALVVLLTLQSMPSVRSLDDLYGLAKNSPAKAVALTIGLLSFAGVPLTAGFIGKFALIAAVVDKSHPVVIVLVALFSLIGIAGVFRVVLYIFGEEQSPEPTFRSKVGVLCLVLTLAIIVLGVFPNHGLDFIAGYAR